MSLTNFSEMLHSKPKMKAGWLFANDAGWHPINLFLLPLSWNAADPGSSCCYHQANLYLATKQ